MSSDIRAALERLIELDDTVPHNRPGWIQEWTDAIAAARAALAAKPVGERPSPDYARVPQIATKGEIRAAALYLIKKKHLDGDLIPAIEYAIARWGRPAAPPAPEQGEVGEQHVSRPYKLPEPGEVGDQERLRIMEAGIRSGYMAGHNDTVEACYGDPDEFAADNAPEILGEVSATFEAMLAQPPAPAPVMVVPVGVAECPHCGYEGEMARAPQAGEGEG